MPVLLLSRFDPDVKFALTAGLSSLGSPHFVVVAGLAELFSGAISMGVGGYLSTKAERDNYRYLLRQTRQRVETSCSAALEREVFNILAPYGVSSADCQRLVHSLENAEKAGHDSGESDRGLTQFLLKFGTGVETISAWRLYASALTIGISYFVGGLIPMVSNAVGSRLISDTIFHRFINHQSALYIDWYHGFCTVSFRCYKGSFDWISKRMAVACSFCSSNSGSRHSCGWFSLWYCACFRQRRSRVMRAVLCLGKSKKSIAKYLITYNFDNIIRYVCSFSCDALSSAVADMVGHIVTGFHPHQALPANRDSQRSLCGRHHCSMY